MSEFKSETVEHLLTLSESDKGWTEKLNRVSFNGAEPKFDIRSWSPDHSEMGKGVALTNERFKTILDTLRG